MPQKPPGKITRFLASFAAVPVLAEYRNVGEQTPTLKEWGFNAAIAKPLEQWGCSTGLAHPFEPKAGQWEGAWSWNPAFLKAAVAQHVALFGALGRSDVPDNLLKFATLPWPTTEDGQRLEIADIVPMDTHGWPMVRQALFDEYESPANTYRIAWDREDARWINEPNESGIKDTVADTLNRFGANRLQCLGCDLMHWDCEITQVSHLAYTVSFFNSLGGRLTLYGVTMTANRSGVVGIDGMTVNC